MLTIDAVGTVAKGSTKDEKIGPTRARGTAPGASSVSPPPVEAHLLDDIRRFALGEIALHFVDGRADVLRALADFLELAPEFHQIAHGNPGARAQLIQFLAESHRFLDVLESVGNNRKLRGVKEQRACAATKPLRLFQALSA